MTTKNFNHMLITFCQSFQLMCQQRNEMRSYKSGLWHSFHQTIVRFENKRNQARRMKESINLYYVLIYTSGSSIECLFFCRENSYSRLTFTHLTFDKRRLGQNVELFRLVLVKIYIFGFELSVIHSKYSWGSSLKNKDY